MSSPLRKRYAQERAQTGITRRVSGATKVYSASAWWPDNDPSIQVVALDAHTAETKLLRAVNEQENEANEDYEEDADMGTQQHMRWSGVHSFSLADLAKGGELKEAIRELKDAGYWYAPTY